jgi:hypothetical protein
LILACNQGLGGLKRLRKKRTGHDAENEKYFHENLLINDPGERWDIESLAGERRGLRESVMRAGVGAV